MKLEISESKSTPNVGLFFAVQAGETIDMENLADYFGIEMDQFTDTDYAKLARAQAQLKENHYLIIEEI